MVGFVKCVPCSFRFQSSWTFPLPSVFAFLLSLVLGSAACSVICVVCTFAAFFVAKVCTFPFLTGKLFNLIELLKSSVWLWLLFLTISSYQSQCWYFWAKCINVTMQRTFLKTISFLLLLLIIIWGIWWTIAVLAARPKLPQINQNWGGP